MKASHLGALVFASLGATYLVTATALGHNARSEAPLDLHPRASEAGVEPVRAAALLVERPSTVVLDVRPARDFALYHLPGAESEPGAPASRIAEWARAAEAVLLVATSDVDGLALVDAAR